MDLTTDDIDTLLFDWAVQCCPMLNTCPELLGTDRTAVLTIAHKMVDPNFYSTDPEMTISSEIYSKLGINVTISTCKRMRSGWIRISKLQQTIVDWLD